VHQLRITTHKAAEKYREVEDDMLMGRATSTVPEKFALLNCQRLPARLNTSETALLLGFQDHDIGPLVAAKLLVPLGKPAPNAPKYFAAVEIVDCAANSKWLTEATKAIAKHWRRKNQGSTVTNHYATAP
jgi:hypothetical protein